MIKKVTCGYFGQANGQCRSGGLLKNRPRGYTEQPNLSFGSEETRDEIAEILFTPFIRVVFYSWLLNLNAPLSRYINEVGLNLQEIILKKWRLVSLAPVEIICAPG